MRHWLSVLKRHWLYWLVIIIAAIVVFSRRGEIARLGQVLAQGRWQWLLAAAGLQAVFYAVSSLLYHYAFATVGVKIRVRDLVPLLFASIFVATVTPPGILGSAAIFIDEANRRGQSPARTGEGLVLVWVAGNASLLPVLAVGLASLAAHGALVTYELVGSVLFIFYIALVTVALLAGLWQPLLLYRLFARFQRGTNRLWQRFRHRPLLAPVWAAHNARELIGAAHAIAGRPGWLARTSGAGLASHLLNLASLYTVFLAFNQPVDAGLAAAGFALGLVFSVVIIVPYEIGVVIVIMTVVFTSLGVPAAASLVIVLAYRGINAWLPVVVGLVYLRRLGIFGGRSRPPR